MSKAVLRDGTCAEKCPAYDALDETGGLSKKKCVAGATCSGSDVLKQDGTCSATCPTYEFKNDDTKKCETVSCANQ